ncbi:hypothetical protein F5Y15DRAFT_32073 [Xylariaceae sp. FL0016]|nr:hypothetical protein F5Y15DRAFT_32073 [Xylariaceae sp. FL0016]
MAMSARWIIVTVAICVFITALLFIAWCIRVRLYPGHSYICCWRERKQKQQQGLPRSLLQALTQIEGVTHRRPRRNPQHASEDQDCPICLSFLYSSEGEAEAESGARAQTESDLEAGQGVSGVVTKPTAISPVAASSKEKRCSIPRSKDDVVKMKRCSHMFHARCLATWFLREKYACPVCRTPYYQPVGDLESDVDYRYRYEVAIPAVPFW